MVRHGNSWLGMLRNGDISWGSDSCGGETQGKIEVGKYRRHELNIGKSCSGYTQKIRKSRLAGEMKGLTMLNQRKIQGLIPVAIIPIELT